MARGGYFKERAFRTTIKGIILVVILVCLSVANKTILVAPLVQIGSFTKMWVSLSQILGIYLGIQYLEVCIDIVYFYVFKGGWKSEFRTEVEPEEVTLEVVQERFERLQRDFRHLSVDIALLEEE